jgi:hypothetical protein
VNAADLAHWRLYNLGLTGPRLATPEDAVRRLGAVQSQEYAAAQWSLAQRTAGVGADAVERACAEGRIIRTHVLRPTWHFVDPADLRWLLALTGPRVHALNSSYCRQFGLDDATLARTTALLAGALRGGNHRTRRELQSMLAGAGVEASGPRLAYVLMYAELEAVICSGPMNGRQHTYALLDERVPAAAPLDPDEALAALILRYFTSHGPATEQDLRWWSSLPLAAIRRGLDLVGDRLTRAELDGRRNWFAGDPPAERDPSPTVHLLQGFDEYLVGYSGASKWVLDVSGAFRAAFPDRPVYNNVLLLDGQVAGYWKRTRKRGSALIEVAVHAPLDADGAAALRSAADRHGAYLGLDVEVVVSVL